MVSVEATPLSARSGVKFTVKVVCSATVTFFNKTDIRVGSATFLVALFARVGSLISMELSSKAWPWGLIT